MARRSEVRPYIIKGMSHSTIIRWRTGSHLTVIAQPFLQKVIATGIRQVLKSQITVSSNINVEKHKECGTIDVNKGWPENACYVPAAPGSHNISLKAQPKHIKMVLKSAIIHVTRATLFDTASLHQTCKNSGNIIAKLSWNVRSI